MKRKFIVINPNQGRESKLPKVVFNEKHEAKVIFSENEVRFYPLESTLPDHHQQFIRKYPSHLGTSSRIHHKGIGNMVGEPVAIRRTVWLREVDDHGLLGPVEIETSLITYRDSSFAAVLRDVDGHIRSVNSQTDNAFGPCGDVITFRKDYLDNGLVEIIPVLMDSVVIPYASIFEDKTGSGDYDLVPITPERANLRATIMGSYDHPFSSTINYMECFSSNYISQNLLGCFFLFECEISGSFILRIFGFVAKMLFKDRFIFEKYFEWKCTEISKYISKNKS